MKKLASFVLALLLVFSAAPAVLAADSGILGYNITWSYNSGTGTLTLSGSGVVRRLYPNEKRPWNEHTKAIKSILIGDNIVEIYSELISNYPNLVSLRLGEGLAVLPMITGCDKLTAVTLPQTLTTIGKMAFYDCRSLKSITIPKNVSVIEDYAFASSSFDSIFVAEANKHFTSEDGILYSKDKSVVIRCPLSKLSDIETLEIPGYVRRIEPYAYSSASPDDPTGAVKRVIFPDGLETIGSYAFYGYSALELIELPASLKSIGAGAFGHCPELSVIHYGGSLEQWASVERGGENEPLQSARLLCGITPGNPEAPGSIDMAELSIIERITEFFRKLLTVLLTLLNI